MGKPKSKAADKGKKQKKVKKSSQKWKMYTASGDSLQRKSNFCPKCGIGVFMAKHKDRLSCGKCHYTEFSSKKS